MRNAFLYILWGVFLSFLGTPAIGQNALRGKVVEAGSGQGIPFTTLHWVGTNVGAYSDSAGNFSVALSPQTNRLVVSSVGFNSDTLSVADVRSPLTISLKPGITMQEVKVEETRSSAKLDYINPIQTQIITAKELQKAACCNLSESFETSPAVDVSYADALTGARQIQMLGLSGQYTLLTQENLPGPRGIFGNQGLGLIPGPWIQSIQLVKGAGSVANGYESVAGQINVELWKADSTTQPLFNFYANVMKRLEANGIYHHTIGKRLDATALVHVNQMQHSPDRNGDGFRDLPEGRQGNALLRFRYWLPKDWVAQLGVHWVEDKRVGGQTRFHGDLDPAGFHGFGMKSRMGQKTLSGKLGKVFAGAKYKSLGFLWSVGQSENNTSLGYNQYMGEEKSATFTAVYQSILGTTDHQYRVGAGGFWNEGDESLNQVQWGNRIEYQRTEWVPGAFAEYTGQWGPRVNAVLGFRADYHNLFGLLLTPRAHFRYEVTTDLTLRASAGKGRRLSSLLADNLSFLASNREWMSSPTSLKAYGFQPDAAWNTGASASQTFRIGRRRGTLTADYFYTWFQKQVVTDLETPGQIRLYPLEGQSFAHSFSVQWDQFLTRKIEMRLAYRWVDSRTQYQSAFLQKPFLANHRGFANLAWNAPKKWKLDATLQWTGNKRLPGSVEGNFPSASPDFFTLNAQISKAFSFGLELYAGVENATDYRQTSLIINPNDPHATGFDAGMIWGPIIGRMGYGGLRFSW